MTIDDFVFVTAEYDTNDTIETFVVQKDKLESFIKNWTSDYNASATLYVNKAVLYINGSIGKGDFMFNKFVSSTIL